MKTIDTYISEKLIINKDSINKNSENPNSDLEKIDKHLRTMMFNMNWFGTEYKLEKVDNDTIRISFKINITEHDLNSTMTALKNRLRELLNHTNFEVRHDLSDYEHNILIQL